MNSVARVVATTIAFVLLCPAQGPLAARAKKDQQQAWVSVLNKGVFLKGHKPASGALSGRVLVVNQWATWCVPCVKEIPDLNKLVDGFSSRGVEFIAVTSEHPRTVVDFLRRAPSDFRYRQKVYAGQSLGRIRRSLAAAGHKTGAIYPQHTVIGVDGSILFHQLGYSESIGTVLSKAIEAALAAGAGGKEVASSKEAVP